jgi:hypothetical protein
MLQHSRVVSFDEGVDLMARRIFTYMGNDSYLTTIRGVEGVGKTHFGREVIGRLYFQKSGTMVKPHDLEREQRQKGKLDYVLLEVDQFDNPYDELIDLTMKKLCGKVPDYRIMIVHELAPLLDEKVTLSEIFKFFDLIVENKNNPAYRQYSAPSKTI